MPRPRVLRRHAPSDGRLQAVERFERGEKNKDIGAALGVSERSEERWRKSWREQGEAGVLSEGLAGTAEAGAGPDGVLGAGVGVRSALARVAGSAVDPGEDQDADRSAAIHRPPRGSRQLILRKDNLLGSNS
ncbi:helix-turn-helix domain-containing protein [Streptomyces sp. NPDC059909]|uniref:helix-turn-helix domain-containing protein n=1 Tax=Streptomyces sp. NPDC059909 TaxID=3346998 RepID=UPI003650746F